MTVSGIPVVQHGVSAKPAAEQRHGPWLPHGEKAWSRGGGEEE